MSVTRTTALMDIERRNTMRKNASEKPTITSMYRGSNASLASDRPVSPTFKKEMLDSPTGFHRRLEAIVEETRGHSFKLEKNFGLMEPEV